MARKPANDLPLQTMDVEAEEGYLGTLLGNPDAFYQAGWLTPEDFQVIRNGWIFEAICKRHEDTGGEEYSALAVQSELARMGKLGPDLVDVDYLRSLPDRTPTWAHAEHYASRIRQAKRKRELQRVIERAVSSNGVDPVVKIAGLLAGIDELFPDPATSKAERYSTWADLESVIGPIEWDWPGWLAKGFAHLVAAEPGLGKSMLGLRIAGTYLLGWPWPDGTAYAGERGRVLWCESEGAQALNLQRAQAWGLPIGNILSPTGNPLDSISLEDLRHLDSIRRLAGYDDVRLIVVDSFSGSNSRDENDVTSGLLIRTLAEIARDSGKPLLLTHHLNKLFKSNKITLANVRGSTAIAQYTRLVWAMDSPDPNTPEALRLYTIKNNIGRMAGEIGLTITDTGIQTLLEAPKPPKGETAVDRAVEFLLDLLDREPVPTNEIAAAFEEAGLSEAALRRARSKLNVLSIKHPSGAWLLSLPARKSDEAVH